MKSKDHSLIFETFIRLTSRTYPYGTEDSLVKSMVHQGIFPSDIKKDSHGNYFYKIGDSRTIFASHLDTVSKDSVKVVHTFDDNIIGTDGKTTLGADDKAGVTILLHLIKNNVPGLYYFFIGEEVGCIGSGLAASEVFKFKGEYDRIISFDRRGTDSIITYQSSYRCCSDEFADALADQLNFLGLSYKKDEGGIYTDSAEFTDIIPECTNISVGYYKEHTVNETQDIRHLEKLAQACLLVDWENLPTKRDMNKKEYKYYSSWDNFSSCTLYNKNYNNRSYSDWDYPSSTSNFKSDIHLEEWEIEYSQYKKTRRGNKKKGREFFDLGNGNLVPVKDYKVNINSNKNYYESLTDKILSEDLTMEELEIIKEQYLDMNIESDRAFYQYLLGNIIDSNQ